MADVPKSVIQKLMFFTAAMVLLPVSTFFVCKYIFEGNDIVNGGVSALVANVVLIGYIIAAFSEDSKTDNDSETNELMPMETRKTM